MSKRERIIQSMLDTDMYKLTMQQAVIQKFQDIEVTYELFRSKQTYNIDFIEQLNDQIASMCDLQFTKCELEFLRSFHCFDDWYIDFLSGYQFDSDEVFVRLTKDNNLKLYIEGPWYRTILWETPLLALITELSYQYKYDGIQHSEGAISDQFDRMKEDEKNPISVADFGTRRRFSYDYQDELLSKWANYKDPEYPELAGTSNLHFAHKHVLRPVGTMAHEWVSAHGAVYGYHQADYKAMEHWLDVYDGQLNFALGDTYSQEVFLRSFKGKMGFAFDGVRIDSGDPYVQGEILMEHYREELGIDPTTKTFVFSDGLSFHQATELYHYFNNRYNIPPIFGIGGGFLSTIEGIEPKNIVIKLTSVKVNKRRTPVIKISDTPGKETGDEKEIKYAKRKLGL